MFEPSLIVRDGPAVRLSGAEFLSRLVQVPHRQKRRYLADGVIGLRHKSLAPPPPGSKSCSSDDGDNIQYLIFSGVLMSLLILSSQHLRCLLRGLHRRFLHQCPSRAA